MKGKKQSKTNESKRNVIIYPRSKYDTIKQNTDGVNVLKS